MKGRKYLAPAIFVAAASIPLCASATTINNGLHFSGDVTISTDPMTGNGTLTFDNVTGQNYTFTIDAASGNLSGLTGGGTAKPIGSVTAPINTKIDIPDFLTFVNNPNLSFTLTYVFGGIDGTGGCSADPNTYVPGTTCSPAGTPYNLQDLVSTLGNKTSSASFVVEGILVDGSTQTPASITFSSADTGESLEQILNDQEHGISDTITFGAQLIAGSSTTPSVAEPATSSLMLGAGLVLVGCMFRNRNRRTH